MLVINNLINNGLKKPYLSKFLSIEEQKQLINQNKVRVAFSNLYDDEIRKRAIVYPNNIELDDFDYNITILELTYDHHFGEIKHPQILGVIMSLGITRESIGDIIVDKHIYIIVCSEITSYIKRNLLIINNIGVTLTEVETIDDVSVNYISQNILVPSLRLDSIISKITNLSREKAKEYIVSKRVQVNGVININNDYICKMNDVLSISRYGRVIIREVKGTSKKGKIILNVDRTK